MRSKEYLRLVKEKLNSKKKEALRSNLKKKKHTQGEKTCFKDILEGAFKDATPEKLASHLKFKALALQGNDIYMGFNKKQQNLLFNMYDLTYSKSKSKKDASRFLVQKILSCQAMPSPHYASWRQYNLVVANFNAGTSQEPVTVNEESQAGSLLPLMTAPVAEERVTAERAEATSPGQPRKEKAPRRKRFVPDEQQKKLLEDDFRRFVGNVPGHVSLQRASEFSVHKSQILRWLAQYSKKQ